MTVSYSSEVFTSKGAGVFLKLLFRWKGSIYKLVWYDLVIYVILYYTLSFVYRFVLDNAAKTMFEAVVIYCEAFSDLIPITFVLGFYVSMVISRWWNQYESLPWPDSAAVWITTCIHGQDERGRLMRRTVIRYMNLSLILTLRLICLPVKKRFPTLDHLVDAGIMMESEKNIIEKNDMNTSHPKYWMPLVWAGSILTRARKEGRIKDDYSMKSLINQIDKFRALAGGLLNYDYISVPLVYTQVVTLAVYTFLLSTLLGRQFLDPTKNYPGHKVDLIVPIFTFLQFFFYMGWLKVAEALINPFGEDDDDFEMNWMIDRNLQVSYLIVDEMHSEHPELVRDQFWDDVFPELPYTVASEQYRLEPHIGSTANIEITGEDAEFIPMPGLEEEQDEEDDEENRPIIMVANGISNKSGDELSEIIVNKKEINDKIKNENNNFENVSIKSGKTNKMKRILSHPFSIRNGKSSSTLRSIGATDKGSIASTDLAGSTNTIGKSSGSRRPSLASVLHNMFHGRAPGSTAGGDVKRNNRLTSSNVSLLSRGSRQRKPRRPNARGVYRSTSRVSTYTQPQSPNSTTTQYDRLVHNAHDGSMYKMSSTSSINSHVLDGVGCSESEFSTRRNSKLDFAEYNASSDHHPLHRLGYVHSKFYGGSTEGKSGFLPTVSKKAGHKSGHAQPHSNHHIPNSNNLFPIDANTHTQNKLLRLKLMAIQSLQGDILSFLDDEIEQGKHHDGPNVETSDAGDVINMLEERTDELRRVLLRRQTDRNGNHTCSPSQHVIQGGILDNDNTDVSQNLGPTTANTPAIHSRNLSVTSGVSAELFQNDDFAFGNAAEQIDSSPLTPKDSVWSSFDCHHTVPAVTSTEHNAELNTNENENNLIENSLSSSMLLRPPGCDEIDEQNNFTTNNVLASEEIKVATTDISGIPPNMAAAGYDIELSTIEEQPELGYNSDSSETDLLLFPRGFPKDGDTSDGIYKRSIMSQNLPTVEEESPCKLDQ